MRDALYRKIQWRLMPFLILCYLAAFIDRSNVGFAKLQFMGDLGFSEAVYGLGAGLFYAGYMLFEVPSNLYLARSGFRRTMLRIMVLWGLASAAMAFMKTATHFYLLRALLGAAEAGFFPGVLLYLTYWVPAERRARFTALFMFSIAISGIVGGPVAGAIMRSLDGWQGLDGWQWLFIVEGLPSCLLGVAAYFYFSDGPAQARWLTADERSQVAADLAREQARKPGSHHRVWAAFGDVRFYGLAAMGYALFASAGGVFFWLPTMVSRAGVTNVWHVGLLSAIPFSAGALAQFWIGRRSDRLQERRWHAVVSALIAALGWALTPFVSGHPVLSVVVLTVVAGGTLASMVPFWTMPAAILSGTAAAAGIALISTVGSMGNLVSPIFIGWIATRTGTLVAGQYYLAGVMVVGAIALATLGRTRAPAAALPRIGAE